MQGNFSLQCKLKKFNTKIFADFFHQIFCLNFILIPLDMEFTRFADEIRSFLCTVILLTPKTIYPDKSKSRFFDGCWGFENIQNIHGFCLKSTNLFLRPDFIANIKKQMQQVKAKHN